MSHALAPAAEAAAPGFRFDYWESQIANLAAQYAAAQPFPHLRLKEFLEPQSAARLQQQFPGADDPLWVHYKHYNENTLGKSAIEHFPPAIRQLVEELSTPRFTCWLSQLVGIADLLPDPDFDGGGIHQTLRGGFLNIHADFSHHHKRPRWRRRCNVILYLNDPWPEEWGGALEAWSADMSHCVAKYPPLLNHAVIFTTDERSLHGYPEPLQCPVDTARKSLALYYYTEDDSTPARARSTNYRARPQDGVRAAWIWLDTQLVHAYSVAKTRLGLSDQFASRVLRWINRGK